MGSSFDKTVLLAVLFSDVVGSTRIYEILGDQKAREIVAGWIENDVDVMGNDILLLEAVDAMAQERHADDDDDQLGPADPEPQERDRRRHVEDACPLEREVHGAIITRGASATMHS